MVQQHKSSARHGCLLVLAGLLALGLAAPAQAAGDKLDTSLKFVPADAAFYSSMLRNREQLDIVFKSNAYAKLMELPAVKQALAATKAAYEKKDFDQVRAILEMPENQELLAVLNDAVSQEIFIYGGESWNDFLNLASQTLGGAFFGPLLMQLSGEARGLRPDQISALAVLRVLAANLNLLKAPELVIGFKLGNSKKADAQLRRLEKFLEQIVQVVPPPLRQAYRKVKIGDASFLTVTLDGSLVPWQNTPIKDLERKDGEFDNLIDKLKTLKLTVSLGVRDDYLLLSIGGSTDPVARLGKGDNLLSRPEFKPLKKFADRRLTYVGYVSKKFNATLATKPEDLDGLVELAKTGLQKAPLTEEQQKRAVKDLTTIVGDIKKMLPEPGAGLSFAFLTDTGMENYDYDYARHPEVDGSKPLTLLNHLGGSPLFAVVGRAASSEASYHTLVKWVKLVYANLDDIALSHLDGEKKEKYQEVTKAVVPLFKRLDEITGTMLIPALADGQNGFVVDAKWSSKQWHKQLPPLPKALPMLEIGLVMGVSDADLLKKAIGEYRNLIHDSWDVIRKLNPDEKIPEFRIPDPKVEKTEAGTLYFYPIPAQAGLDAQVVPTAGLSNKVAVLTLSNGHAERLLASKPLKNALEVMPELKGKLAGAAYFDWAATVDALAPWLETGVTMWFQVRSPKGEEKDGDAPQGEVAEILKQVRTGLEILKCFRNVTSATYLEDGALVTRSVSVVRDLEK
jgi:hypothetical protein